MDRKLNSLDFRFKNVAMELLARLAEAGIPCMIINTRRTAEEQAAAVASGHSWVDRSKHQDGLAMDVCPYEQFSLHGPDKLQWDAKDPIWQDIGAIGERLDLRWGGRWTKKDMGHFEWVPISERIAIRLG